MSALPRGWVKARISDVYNVSRGGSPRPIKDFVTSDPDGLNWIRIADASAGGHRIQAAEQKIDRRGLNKTREVFPGDLLLSNSMSFGRPYITDIQGCIHDGWLVLGGPATSHIDAEFAYRCLSSPKVQRQFDEKASGTTVRNLNTDLVSSVHIEIPPLAEQKRIVAKLDALNAKSARARTELARIETLVSRYKQAVLSKAFSGELTPRQGGRAEIQFTPKHAVQVDGRTPELPALPATWSWVALSSVAEVSGGLTKNSKRESLPLQVPYLRVANVYANELRLDDVSAIGCTENEVSRTTLIAGDLLLVEGNGSLDQIGRVALWGGELEQCVHQNHLIKVRPSGGLNSKFALYWLLSPLGRRAIEAVAASSSGLHTLSLLKVGGLPLPHCNPEEQHEIVRRIESAFAKIDRLVKEAKRALELVGRLDEAILAEAFRGELVPQDENDEPADLLLARIRAERAAAPKGKRGRGRSEA